MSQTYNLPTGSSSVSTNLLTNTYNSLEAIRSSFSGASAPTNPTPLAGQLFWDTINSKLKIYDGDWDSSIPRLDVNETITGTWTFKGGFPNYLFFANDNVAHGMTGWAPTNVYGVLWNSTSLSGGLSIQGISDDVAQAGLSLYGFIGVTDPTDSTPVIYLNGGKKSGTGQQSLGALETVLRLDNASTPLLNILGSGNVGIGTTLPTSKLQVVGLPTYTNNAAAIAGGLTAGAFYRTGADPAPVCVVY